MILLWDALLWDGERKEGRSSVQELVYFVFSLKRTWLVWNFSLSSELLLLLQVTVVARSDNNRREPFRFASPCSESFLHCSELHFSLYIVNFALTGTCSNSIEQKRKGKLLRLLGYDYKHKNKGKIRLLKSLFFFFLFNLAKHPIWWWIRCLAF